MKRHNKYTSDRDLREAYIKDLKADPLFQDFVERYGRPKADFHGERDVYAQVISATQGEVKLIGDLAEMANPFLTPADLAYPVPVIHLSGCTPDGWSICINVMGFLPYFYVEVPVDFQEEHLQELEQAIEEHIETLYDAGTSFDFNAKRGRRPRHIVNSRLVLDKKNLQYKSEYTNRFVQLTLISPKCVRAVRDWMEGHDLQPGQAPLRLVSFTEVKHEWKTFESNLDFVLRFNVNKRIDGASWLRFPADKYRIRDEADQVSNDQLELDINWEDIVACPDEPKWNEPAPFRRLAFDIETVPIDRVSWQGPEVDPVIQISFKVTQSNVFRKWNGDPLPKAESPVHRILFALKGCSFIPSLDLYTFSEENEVDMYRAYQMLVLAVCPDFWTGWNIESYDIPYVLDRAKALGLDYFHYHSRLRDRPVTKKEKTMDYGSGAGKATKKKLQQAKKKAAAPITIASAMSKYGDEVDVNSDDLVAQLSALAMEDKEGISDEEDKIDDKAKRRWEISCPGSVMMDGLLIVLYFLKKNYRQYSLNAVALEVLNEQKADMPYSLIPKLYFDGTDDDRQRVGDYCYRDTDLADRIVAKLKVDITLIEMAKASKVHPEALIKKGQSKKVFTLIFFYCYTMEYLIPFYRVSADNLLDSESVKGAVVLPAKSGFYAFPVITLDYNSLYPSIMQAENLCYSTFIPKHKLKNFRSNQYEVKHGDGGPGHAFMTKETRMGVLPQILASLVSGRKAVRKLMELPEVANDKNQIAILDGRQLALKITANSVYGFTGALLGSLPSLEITGTVTAEGRHMIIASRDLVEAEFTIANGYDGFKDAEIIYGDTDSIFIVFWHPDRAECYRRGKLAEKMINNLWKDRPPHNIELEKMYAPKLLFTQKRYAGLKFEFNKDGSVAKMYVEAKGIESVRRDNFLLVAELVSNVLKTVLVKKEPYVDEKNSPLVSKLMPPDFGPEKDKAVALARRAFQSLLLHQVEYGKLIVSRKYSKEANEYHNPQPHVELVKKMAQRDPTTAPKKDSRVPYVLLAGTKDQPVAFRSEDPFYALQHNRPIDTDYYISLLIKPVMRIFEPLIGFDMTAKTIFKGEHMKTRKVQIDVSPLDHHGMVLRTVPRCLICRVKLASTNSFCQAYCRECSYQRSSVIDKYMEIKKQYDDSRSKHQYLETWCLQCQGDLANPLICANSDCSIFYLRHFHEKNRKEALANLKKFDELW
jgi:DNA polymerase elongation subunit (family B)